MEVLHPRVRLVWGVGATVTALIVAGLVTAVDRFLLGVTPLLGAAVGLVLLAVAAWYVHVLYRDWRFDLEEDALYLERGVLTRVETAVPFVRIQHVDTQRGPLERGLGLASVVVYTAGSRGADVSIPGLTPERARELRNRLRELAIESEPEDAV